MFVPLPWGDCSQVSTALHLCLKGHRIREARIGPPGLREGSGCSGRGCCHHHLLPGPNLLTITRCCWSTCEYLASVLRGKTTSPGPVREMLAYRVSQTGFTAHSLHFLPVTQMHRWHYGPQDWPPSLELFLERDVCPLHFQLRIINRRWLLTRRLDE